MSDKILVCCLGSEQIMLAEFGKAKEMLGLYNVASIPISSEWLKEDNTIDKEKVREVLNKLFSTNGFETKTTFILLPENISLVRLLQIPTMSEREMREVIKGETEQYAMFANQQVSLDFKTQGEIIQEGVRKTNVLISLSSFESINFFLDTFREFNFEVAGIGTQQIASAHILTEEQVAETNYGIVTIGESSSYVHIVKDNNLVFTRVIDIGERQLEEQNIDGGIILDGSINIRQWIQEVESSFRFYQMQTVGGAMPAKIYLIGKKSQIKNLNLVADLKESSGLNIQTVNIFDLLEIKASELQEEFVESLGFNFLLGVGEANRCFQPRNFSLELLPVYLKVGTNIKKEVIYFLTLPLAACLVLFFLVNMFFSNKLKNTFAEKQKLASNVSASANIEQKVTELQKEITDLKTKIKSLKETQQSIQAGYVPQKFSLSNLLREMQKIIPADSWITNLQADETKVEFEGISLGQLSTAKILKGMSNSNLFSSVTLDFTERNTLNNKEIYKFKIIGGINKN